MKIRIHMFCLAVAMTCCCLNIVGQTAFDASRVQTNAIGEIQDLYLLGENEYGQQIWYNNVPSKYIFGFVDIRYINGTDKELLNADYSRTRHNGHDANSARTAIMNIFFKRTTHGIGGSGLTADVCLVVVGETHAWSKLMFFDKSHMDKINDCIDNGIRLYAITELVAEDPVLDERKVQYTQALKWNVSPITDSTLQKVDIMASYNSGKSWNVVHTSNHCCDSITLQIPRTTSNVQYKAVASIREKFKFYFMDNLSQLTSETSDYTIKRHAMPIVMSVDDIRKGFTNARYLTDRSYSPKVTWKMDENFAEAFGSGVIECCPYNTGNHWQKLADITSASGSQTVNVPVCSDSLLFRIIVKPKSVMKQFDDSTTTTLLATSTSAPAFTQIALEESLDNCFDAETNRLTPTLAYAMNDDLYQTRVGAAYIYYCTDFNETWKLAHTINNPQQKDNIQISIPANASFYKFRIFMANMSNNDIATNEIVYGPKSYSETLVLDDTTAYQAMNSYDREVKVLRSFSNGRIGTICLPFALTADQMTAGFGTEAEVYEYTNLTGTVMNFSKVESMEAGKPYLVQTAEDKDYLVFNNVYIDDETQPLPSDISTDYIFTGTFSPYLMKGDRTELFLATDGKLKYPSSTNGQANHLRGYRAFFQINNNTADETKINLNGEVTSVSRPIADVNCSTKIYNLNGQCVGNNLNNMPKGVYIINGKKIVK